MGEQEDGSGVQTAAALRLHVAKKKGGGHRQGASRGAGGESLKEAARDARVKAKASPQGASSK
eukprot:5837816-Amphidinium_carterae.1